MRPEPSKKPRGAVFRRLCGLALDALVESAYSIAISEAASASSSSSSFSLAAMAAATFWVFALSRLAFFVSSFASLFPFAASSAALSTDSLFSPFTLESFFRSTDDVSTVWCCWLGGPSRLRKIFGIRNLPNLLCFAKTSWSYIESKACTRHFTTDSHKVASTYCGIE